jgi:murein DD-endopeptidase MepM/ murein hydrolase activator NlpD
MKKFLQFLFVFLCLFLFFTLTDTFAQQKKRSFRQRVGDFIELKIINKIWTPSSLDSLKGKELTSNQEDTKKDSLLLNPNGQHDANVLLKDNVEGEKTGGSSPIEELDPDKEEIRKIEETFKDLTKTDFKKDTTYIKDLIRKVYEKPLDLNEPKSLMREDNSNFYDVEMKKIVMVTEELAIDCVWVTLTNYYAIWDSENINPYKYNIENFKDSLDIQLFDSTTNQLWASPLASVKLTSNFGFRRYRWHGGVDLDLNIGDPVYASFDGIVRISNYVRGGYGRYIVLRHYNGLETLYAHLSKSLVEVGQEIKAGQEIGKGGSTGRSTGPHLHYEVRYQGYAFDPAEIYDFSNNQIKTNLFRLSPDHFKHLTNRRQVVYHTVEKGDTVSGIARMYGISIKTLCRVNRIYTSTKLKIGRKLRVK